MSGEDLDETIESAILEDFCGELHNDPQQPADHGQSREETSKRSEESEYLYEGSRVCV